MTPIEVLVWALIALILVIILAMAFVVIKVIISGSWHPEFERLQEESRRKRTDKTLRKAGIPPNVPDPKDPTRRLPPDYSKDRMDRLP